MKLNRNFVRNLQQAIDLSQEEPSYEVEAILYGYTPGVISRSEYTRVVNGLEGLKLRKTIEPQRLDIRTETRRGGLGNQRQSIREVDAISDYCKSGRIETAIEEGHVEIIRKSIVRRTPTISNLPIQVKDQRFRVNIKTEDILEPETDIVKEELRSWGTALKFFRLIRRVSFHYGNWRIDCSQVRMTPTHNGAAALAVDVISSGVLNQSLRQEVEIEHVWEEGKGERNSEKDLKDLLKLITIIRRRITNNQFISSAKMEYNVIRSLRELTGVGIFPGPMPITLEPVHLDPSTGSGIQTDQVVTEKADGERKLLMFDGAGDGQFIDRSRTVFAAGLRGPANSLLDGENIVTDAGELFYLVFDTQWIGNRGVWDKPLIGGKDSRIEYGKQIIAAIERVNPIQSPRVFMKDFATASGRGGIWAAAKRILGRTYPYRTDGLIYTPAKWAVYQERAEDGAPPRFKAGTWRATMKWKPTTDQTVDFLIRRVKGAKKYALDSVTGRSGYFSTQTLNVLDPLGGADIRETLLTGEQEPKDKDKVVEFHPVTPVNPQSGLMYVVDDDDNEPKTEEGELLEDQMIVECRYDIDAKPGWGWRPMRIRHEKTATYRTGRISGTLNSAEVAESIWQQIHLPITEHLITTGEGLDDFLAEAEELNNDGQKQQNRNMRRDELRTKKMSEFHNVIVKRRIVFKTFGRNTGGDAGSSPTFIDVACGKGGDLMKQKETGATFVLGVDIVPDNILNKKDGAVARYLKLRANPRKRDMAPDCIFAISDGASNFAEGDGAGDDTSRTILRKLFGTEPVSAGTPALLRKQGGVLKSGAAGASCMFALHQFFKNSATADRFFGNIARGLRKDGLFAATLFDGDLVERSLDADGVLERRDGRTNDLIWRIERVADDADAGAAAAGGHFGRKIRVYIDSINTHQVEQLVSYDHLLETAGKHGLRPLTGEEAAALGLPGTTELFQDTYSRMRSQGVKVPDLTEPERVQSFLNRWVFLKKE